MHRNRINNKVYIGITSQQPGKRWRHEGKGYQNQPKFYRAIEKYGWDNFDHIILFEDLTEEEINVKEKEFIEKYNAIENGYNADKGGITTNHSPETIEKIRQAMIGKNHTQETKDKIRAIKEQQAKSIECIETGVQYQSLADAYRQTGIDKGSISRCCRGLQHTAGDLHWKYVGEQEKTYESNKQPVLCITTGIAYESMSAAARSTNSDLSNIRKVCIGKYKSTKGNVWKYISEKEYKEYLINNGTD